MNFRTSGLHWHIDRQPNSTKLTDIHDIDLDNAHNKIGNVPTRFCRDMDINVFLVPNGKIYTYLKRFTFKPLKILFDHLKGLGTGYHVLKYGDNLSSSY